MKYFKKKQKTQKFQSKLKFKKKQKYYKLF